MESRPAILHAVLLAVLAVGLSACSERKPVLTAVTVFNVTGANVEFAIDDAKGSLGKRGFKRVSLKQGAHEMVITSAGKEQERHPFSTDPTAGDSFVYNVGASGSFALLDIAGAYSGGGVFTFTEDKGFPIVKLYEGEKLFKLDTKQPAMVTMPMERLPQAPPSMYSMYFLCPIDLAWKGDDAKIRQQCVALLKMANK